MANTSSAAPPTEPPRSTRRLNFTSVGKALVDVINKDSRDREKSKSAAPKPVKKSRLSAITLMPIPSYSNANATHDVSPHPMKTRRQTSLLKPSSDKVPAAVSRSSTLRPRTATPPTSSALPKYRPKSHLIESVLPGKPTSPPRTAATRASEDDKAISPNGPLPHLALAVKVKLPNLTPPSTPSKISKPSSPARSASTYPARSTTANVARPPSSSSSRSSVCSQSSPRTPSKHAFALGRSKHIINQPHTPLRSTSRAAPESPLAHHTRQRSNASLGTTATPTQTSHFAGHDISQDSIEADDVELLLAPAAPLGAPTPAIPRIHAVRHHRHHSDLQTPSRPSQLLPAREDLSYLSPLPPTSRSSDHLRPPNANGINRGSILSWEQLADEGSQIIAQEEVEKMLSEIQAPFTPGGPSPNVSVLEVPESPCFSALPSPGGYGSISHVLLPDVTPSPAMHHVSQVFDTSTDLPPPVDSGIVTLLRLQVASAENMAKERLARLQDLEQQLHAATQSRIKDTEELANQVSFLETQLRISVEARERLDGERAAFTASLQDQLRRADVRDEQATEAAFVRGQKEAAAAWAGALTQNEKRWQVCGLAQEIKVEWSSVKEQAEVEQEFLRESRETLKIFLAMLDQSQMQMQGLLA